MLVDCAPPPSSLPATKSFPSTARLKKLCVPDFEEGFEFNNPRLSRQYVLWPELADQLTLRFHISIHTSRYHRSWTDTAG